MIRSKPSLPAVLLGTSVVLSLALAGLAWRLFDQQADLDRQRVAEQTGTTADAIAAGLQRRFAETGDLLSASFADATTSVPRIDGAVVVIVRDGRSVVDPDARLPYLPSIVESGVPGPLFADAERAEFAARDVDAAATAYRHLAAHPRAEVRAGALARLGRALRSARRFDEAHEAFDRLSVMRDERSGGLPAGLLGLDGQRLVYQARGDAARSRRTADRIVAGIDRGEWAITRGMAEFYRDELGTSLPNRVGQMSWTGDGRAVLAIMVPGPVDSPIFRIDVDSGAVELTGRSGPLNVLSFSSLSPDGSRVVLQASSVTGAKPELFAIDNVSAFLKAAK